jgi:DNA polymerase-2
LTNRPDFVSPKFRKTFQLEVSYDGEAFSLESEQPADVLHSLNHHLKRCDPDIIMTEYGDAILLPMLTRLSSEYKIPIPLNRDASAGYFTTKESSYFVYGKIVHKDGAFELAGRWHLDSANSFLMDESNLDGIVEIARLTQLPVQHQSRSSIGTALSSMQFSWAYRNNYLIPAKKREPEDFKSAATLLLADRGGLIFQPIMGYHEQVAELDFVSMYPNIMVQHNVSPETVNCACCEDKSQASESQRVPELQYTICGKREGIVPATLRPIVERRSFYKKEKKRLKKLGDERWHLYDHRQNALKWILVTCFGYLGYKNARFGKIEAHESVNAFSREKILQAKEIAERHGYQFMHAIVDCMWLKKEGATEADYERLCNEVTAATSVEISLEGIYNWILYPSSKMDPLIPTANRYVGFYSNGDVKIRGIEVRRRDTPKFIKQMQGEILSVFENAKSVDDVASLVPQALAKAKEFLDVLRSGKADPLELVIRRHISKEADEYTTNTASAVVAKALDEAGIKLQPGEMVEYIILDATGKKKPEKANSAKCTMTPSPTTVRSLTMTLTSSKRSRISSRPPFIPSARSCG